MPESQSDMALPQKREEALFQATVQLIGAERAAFLNGACLGDNALRQRLDALLTAHDQPDNLVPTQAEAVRLREDASSITKASADKSALQARPTIKLDLAD